MIYLLYSYEQSDDCLPVATDCSAAALRMFDSWINQPLYSWLDESDLLSMRGRLAKLIDENNPGDYDLLIGADGPLLKLVPQWKDSHREDT